MRLRLNRNHGSSSPCQKGSARERAYQLNPLDERLSPSQMSQEVSNGAKMHWPQPESRYASKV